jgi:hypothetical protein
MGVLAAPVVFAAGASTQSRGVRGQSALRKTPAIKIAGATGASLEKTECQ